MPAPTAKIATKQATSTQLAPTTAAEEAPIEAEEAPESKWKPYLIYGGIAAGVLAAAGLVAVFMRR